MRIVYRSANAEYVNETDSAGGRILGIIGKSLPHEVAAIAHNGTRRRPEWTTRDELASAILTVQQQIAADPALLLAYSFSTETVGETRPTGRWSGISGIRFPDTPADRVYALECGPGECDLVEMVIGATGRGSPVGTVDLRGEQELETANFGRIRIHRRRLKTQLLQELEKLQAAVEQWPPGEVAKFARLRE